MVFDRLHIDNLLQRVLKNVVTGDLKQESLTVTQTLADRLVHEGSHEEVVRVDLPLDLVVALQHARLVVGRHQPVVLTRVELLRTCQWQVLINLLESAICPLGLE